MLSYSFSQNNQDFTVKYGRLGFSEGSEVKSPSAMPKNTCNAGDLSCIPTSGKSPGEGNDNPLQYSCRENPMDSGTW